MSNLIRLQDAIAAMYRLEAEDIETYGCSIPEGFDSKPAIEALRALPSADPERTAKVTDTWKVGGFDELNAWCPECEHRITRGCSYCPTCGVKLDWSE